MGLVDKLKGIGAQVDPISTEQFRAFQHIVSSGVDPKEAAHLVSSPDFDVSVYEIQRNTSFYGKDNLPVFDGTVKATAEQLSDYVSALNDVIEPSDYIFGTHGIVVSSGGYTVSGFASLLLATAGLSMVDKDTYLDAGQDLIDMIASVEDVFVTDLQAQVRDKMSFSSDRDGPFDIYLMNDDGTNPVNITAVINEGADFTDYAWSADGKHLAINATVGALQTDIVVVDVENVLAAYNATDTPGLDRSPSWSQDQGTIVFESKRDGNWDVYRMNADGTAQLNLTNTSSPNSNHSPSISPDGDLIVYESTISGNGGQIHIMGMDGSDPIELTQILGTGERPTWSPSADKIAYIASTNDGYSIQVIHEDDGSIDTLVDGMGIIPTYPVWSDDGSHIAFSANTSGNWEIYKVNVNKTARIH